MRDRYGITIAGGQGKLKGKIARIAHCGYFGPFDIVVTISAFEMTLRELGHEVELGAGVAAAQRVFLAGLPARRHGVKVLVAEKIGDSGVDAASQRRLRGGAWARLGGRRAREADRRVRRPADPIGHEAGRRAAREGRQAEGRRPRRSRRRQRRRRRGHEAGRGGGQRPAVERDHGGGAHHGAAARAGAQRAAGALLAHRRGLGPLQVQRRGARREDARHPRLRSHRAARGAAGARLRHARGGLRRLRRRGALRRPRSRAGGDQRRALRQGGLHHPPPAEDARDRGLARRRGAVAR